MAGVIRPREGGELGSPPVAPTPRPVTDGRLYGAGTSPISPPAAVPGGVYQSSGAQPPGGQVATGGGPAPTRRRRRGLIAAILSAVLLVALLGAGITVQLVRPLPAATVTLTAPAMTGAANATPADATPTVSAPGSTGPVQVRIPGSPVTMPWPEQGQAGMMVDGIGSLGGSGGDTPAPIGSVAKVMTAYVILSGHPLDGDAEGPTLTVTDADVADYRSRIPSGQSLVAVAAGERLTQRDALEALLLPSANNMAHLLAVWDAGSQEAFVAKMNAVVDRLKLTGSHYTDPSGFEPSTVSTAADQIVLAREALKLPAFAGIVAQRSAAVPVAGTVRNYNDLLGVAGVFGIKTGSTDEAGGNLLFAAHLTVAGRTLTVVGAVFNQPGSGTPQQLARVNVVVRELLAAAKRAVRPRVLLPADPVGQVRTAWGDTVTARPAAPLRVIGWPGLAVPVTTTRAGVGSTVTAGQVLASVQARQGIGSTRVDVRAETGTSKPSLWWRLTRTH